MQAKRVHDSRPAIEPGQILPLAEFLFRARISRSVWLLMRSQATEHGHAIALRIGAKTFVDATAFVEFLKTATTKKLNLTGGAA